jgi:hypothetical protein
MQVLANAADQAQVIIGTGLLDALIEVGKDTSIEISCCMHGNRRTKYG